MWQMYTGTAVNTVTEKARLFVDPLSNSQGAVINYNTSLTNARFNHFSQLAPQGDIIFFARGASRNQPPALPGIVMERMRISAGHFDDMSFSSPLYQDYTRVSISARGTVITDPLAMLHIGDPTFYALGGHRPWMNYGIFINKHDDNVFLGEKQDEFNLSPIGNAPDFNDHQHAVLVWTDNTTNPNTSFADVFRIMFSGVFDNSATAGTANHMNALEAMSWRPYLLRAVQPIPEA